MGGTHTHAFSGFFHSVRVSDTAHWPVVLLLISYKKTRSGHKYFSVLHKYFSVLHVATVQKTKQTKNVACTNVSDEINKNLWQLGGKIPCSSCNSTQSKPYTTGTALLSDAVSNCSLLALVCHIPCFPLPVVHITCYLLFMSLWQMEGGEGAGKQTSLRRRVRHKVSMYCNHLQMMVDLHNPFFVLTFQHALVFFTKCDAGFPYQTLHASHM